MKRAICTVTLLIAAACPGGLQAEASDSSQKTLLARWQALVDAKKFDEAASLMTGDASVKDDQTGVKRTIPARVFVEWITRCAARQGSAYAMPMGRDGTVTVAFHRACEQRRPDGSFVVGPFPVQLGFFVSSNGKSIRVW